MSAAREKDQADFDLEAFIELFDEALTSDDPSVQKTLQHLMVICALARNHDNHNPRVGPLRRIFEDQNHILRRLERLEVGNAQFGNGKGWPGGGYNPSAPYGPGIAPITQPNNIPGGGPAIWPSPNTIWTTSNPGTTWSGPSNMSAQATTAGDAIAERVENLLKDEKYKGSSVGRVDVKIA
jgi:hypothetical protein